MANRTKFASPHQFFYGWVIVIASSFCLLDYVFMSNSAGVFFKPMLNDMGWTRGVTAGVFSLSMLISGIVAPGVGILYDKYGPRVIEMASGIFLAAGAAATAMSGTVWQLYISYGLLIGLSSGTMWVPVASATATWFVKRRGIALSLIQAGAGLGTIIGPSLATFMIYRFNWRFAFLVLGVTMGVLTFIAAQFLRRSPQSMGQLPDGGVDKPVEKTSVQPVASARNVTVRQALRRADFWQVFFAHGLASFAQQTIIIHLVAAATDRQITPAVAATFVSIMGITNIAGKLAMGYMSDRIGRRIAISFSLGLAIACLLWLTESSVPWMFLAFAIAWGFAYGSWIPMFPALTGDLFGVKSLGSIFGLITLGNAIGGAAGGFLGGVIFDRTQSYTVVFLLSATLLAVGIMLVLLLKDPKRTKKMALSGSRN